MGIKRNQSYQVFAKQVERNNYALYTCNHFVVKYIGN